MPATRDNISWSKWDDAYMFVHGIFPGIDYVILSVYYIFEPLRSRIREASANLANQCWEYACAMPKVAGATYEWYVSGRMTRCRYPGVTTSRINDIGGGHSVMGISDFFRHDPNGISPDFEKVLSAAQDIYAKLWHEFESRYDEAEKLFLHVEHTIRKKYRLAMKELRKFINVRNKTPEKVTIGGINRFVDDEEKRFEEINETFKEFCTSPRMVNLVTMRVEIPNIATGSDVRVF